jgi:hypothetical protein
MAMRGARLNKIIHKSSDLYSTGAQLESEPRHRLSSLWRFVALLSPSRKIPGYRLKLGHAQLLPHPTILRCMVELLTEPHSMNHK